MQAKAKSEGDVIVVELSGKVDLESTGPFRQVCMEKLFNKKVVFNLEKLNFVGSNGITPFINTMKALSHKSGRGLKMCGLQAEFCKIFAANFTNEVEFYSNSTSAIKSFIEPQTTIPLVLESEFVESEEDFCADPNIPMLADSSEAT